MTALIHRLILQGRKECDERPWQRGPLAFVGLATLFAAWTISHEHTYSNMSFQLIAWLTAYVVIFIVPVVVRPFVFDKMVSWHRSGWIPAYGLLMGIMANLSLANQMAHGNVDGNVVDYASWGVMVLTYLVLTRVSARALRTAPSSCICPRPPAPPPTREHHPSRMYRFCSPHKAHKATQTGGISHL